MLRRGIIVAAICLLPAIVNAQAARGPWELTLGGGATNGSRFNGFSASANAGIGWFMNDNIELGVRQSISYTDIGPKTLNGSTRVAIDLHFPLGDQGQFVPFIGANGGYVYGDSVSDTWEIAPEGGLKWFLNNTTFVYGMVEYQVFLDRHSNVNNAFNDGVFVYTLGIGVRF
jgi:hypothetical protein